jgi:hydroxyquinol 1,2-dioxygenase
MRDLDEATITEAVLASFAQTPDPRLQALVSSLVSHLHGFIRDTEPSIAEWGQAVEFLTRVGQISVGGRQEFILLSDVLGVSTLVDAINHRGEAELTPTTVLGPFYLDDPRDLEQGADIAQGEAGTPLEVDVQICSADGQPLAGAVVDVWQASAEGLYDVQSPDRPGQSLRGRFHTDPAGRLRFRTIVPCAYPIPDDGPVGDLLAATKRHPWRPAHVHFRIEADEHETLVTHVFVAGDRYLESDAVFSVKDGLVADLGAPDDAAAGRELHYVFRLARTRAAPGGPSGAAE